MDKFGIQLKKYGDLVINFDYSDFKPKPTSINSLVPRGLYWINNIDNIIKFPLYSTIIIKKNLYNQVKIPPTNNFLFTPTPRLCFSQILTDLYPELNKVNNLKLKQGKQIGYNVYVGDNVIFGTNVKIGNNVTIYDDVEIGNNVLIGDNTIIGTEGMGFEKLPNGDLFKFPQIGGVLIGNNVEIGTHCDIKRGTLNNTIISDGCKMGSYNNIGHNVVIGKNCIITASCVLCGSSNLGNNVFVGPKSMIKDAIAIPNNTIIGGMTFVNKIFNQENLTLIGSPAKKL
tara:strand:+ start:1041 stop:1895 length:855 start_codon:yes stop_codon:yes gene_type:complete